MTEEVLTPTEMLEIMCNSDESSSDSSSDSVSSSDNEIDNITVGDAIIKMTMVAKSKYCTEISGGRLWTIIKDTKKCSFMIFDPEMLQKM